MNLCEAKLVKVYNFSEKKQKKHKTKEASPEYGRPNSPKQHWKKKPNSAGRRNAWGQFLIFSARKRSLGHGNVFTLVCHSVHRGGVASRGLHPGELVCILEVAGLYPKGGSACRGCWADLPIR